jgi:hypothetical protein
MTYSATITDPHAPDAMPMWESFDHADPAAALQAAHTYIHAAQPADRIIDEGHGVYAILTGAKPAERVATLVIDEHDDHGVME